MKVFIGGEKKKTSHKNDTKHEDYSDMCESVRTYKRHVVYLISIRVRIVFSRVRRALAYISNRASRRDTRICA